MRIFAMNLPLILASALVAVEPAPVAANSGLPIKMDLSAYTMTFQDEFEGTTLDTSKWDAPTQERQRDRAGRRVLFLCRTAAFVSGYG